MSSTLSIAGLSGLTLIASVGSLWAILELRSRRVSQQQPQSEHTYRPLRRVDLAIALATLGSAMLFLYRWLWITGDWQPIAAHVDGLLLMATLLGLGLGWLHSRPRMRAITAFAMPMLTLVLGWGICAAAWTYRPFELHTLEPVWRAVHLVCVYSGTVGGMVAASAGSMYLWVQRRVKAKTDPRTLGKLASLETLERAVRNAAAVGFVLLSMGLATGAVLIAEEPGVLGEAWYRSPKVWLSALAWLAFAVVMSVRYATAFRGSRAAWLSIGGFVLLLVVYGLVTAMPVVSEGSAG